MTELESQTQKKIEELVQRVVDLESGLLFVRNFLLQLEQLERSTQFDDSLLEIRRRIHAPIHREIDKLIGAQKPQRAAT